jgi:hypothetical protein
VRDEENVVGFVHCSEGFALGEIALELDHVAEFEKGGAIAGLFDVADEADEEAGTDGLWEGLEGFD